MSFINRDDHGIESYGVSHHRVRVYDSGLRHYINNELYGYSRVAVSGRIQHTTCIKENGRKGFSGFILADKISGIG